MGVVRVGREKGAARLPGKGSQIAALQMRLCCPAMLAGVSISMGTQPEDDNLDIQAIQTPSLRLAYIH